MGCNRGNDLRVNDQGNRKGARKAHANRTDSTTAVVLTYVGRQRAQPTGYGSGDACTQVRRFEDARLALDEGLAIVQKNDERFQEAELHRLKGELLLTEFPDRTAAAEESFRQAIEIARRQLSRAWELRATMSLSRLWQRQGRRDEARAALAAVLNTYTEGFSTPDLMDAATLIRALA